MASTVPGRGPDSAGDGSAIAEEQDKDAVRKVSDKRASFFIRTPSYGDTIIRRAC